VGSVEVSDPTVFMLADWDNAEDGTAVSVCSPVGITADTMSDDATDIGGSEAEGVAKFATRASVDYHNDNAPVHLAGAASGNPVYTNVWGKSHTAWFI
jgi:hypothetical protein